MINPVQTHDTDPLVGESLPEHPLMTWGLLTTRRLTGQFATTSPRIRELESIQSKPLRGQFEHRKLIGRGGMGEVWLAHEPLLQRNVALKWLHRPESESVEAEQFGIQLSFMQEAIISAQLDHPNIVPLYSLTRREDEQLQIAMKYVEGRRWDTILQEHPGLEDQDWLNEQLRVLVQVSQAVALAHSKGIIHRDIKPSQVIVGEFGEVYLMDWGLAVVTDESRWMESQPISESMRIGLLPTQHTAVNPAGTPAYMAPEQTELDGQHLGFHTDIYLLGGLLYTLLTGRAPRQTIFSAVAFEQAKSGYYGPFEKEQLSTGVTMELFRLCEESLLVNVEARPKSVQEFIQRVEDFRAGTSRRHESVEVTAEVSKLLARAPLDYEQLLEAEMELSRAIEMWGNNQTARTLRQNVLGATAQLALRNKDLRLARLLVERMEPSSKKQELQGQIKSRERNVFRHALQRCWSIRSTFALAVAFFLLFLWYYRQNSLNAESRQDLEERIYQLEQGMPKL